ncbi:hypothetical protein LRD18_12970, partial [Halorhodospira halochloris]|uniref:hypothetical protein n=1 Tax=Halorhodospira halochloris TaxID=1052 RepID=UPI001EE84532
MTKQRQGLDKPSRRDHDRRMQELVLDYPEQALQLFAADEAERIDQGAKISSLRQEMSKHKLSRPLRRLDVPMLVEWSNGEREGLIFVIESESRSRAFNIHRLAHYCLDLSELKGLTRVVPVVVFLDSGSAPGELRLEGDQGVYLNFWYRSFVLPNHHYSVYQDSDNIVARISLPLMNWKNPQEKVAVCAKAVMGICELEPDPDKQLKWLENVDKYTDLNEDELEQLRREFPQEGSTMTGLVERTREETRKETVQEMQV